jgi:hypothetical protein
MRVEELRRSTLLLIEAAGLTVTAALLFVIALSLQLLVRLISFGALCPALSMLAFGFLFYVCAAFLTAGTHDQPEHPRYVLANVGLHAGFACAAGLLFRSALTPALLLAFIGLSAAAHAGLHLFARLRARRLAALIAHAAARPAASIATQLRVRCGVYRAIPLGAALGTALGALAGASASDIVRHAAAGVFAALALDALLRLVQGSRTLTNELVTRVEQGEVALRRARAGMPVALVVELPEPVSTLEGGLVALAVTTGLRRVLVVDQLARVMILGMATLVLAALESPAPVVPVLGPALLGFAVACTQGAYYVGQRRTRRRVLSALSAELRPRTSSLLDAGAAPRAGAGGMPGLLLAATLGAAASGCALLAVSELAR